MCVSQWVLNVKGKSNCILPPHPNGNRDRAVRGLQKFVCEEEMAERKIIRYLQGSGDALGLSSVESKDWDAPAHI